MNIKSLLTDIGSALTSVLTIIAVAPYELGALGDVIPPEYKAKVVVAGLVATAALRVINAVVKNKEPKELDSKILTK